MYQLQQLAAEHSRSTMERAVQLRPSRRLQALHRALRMERKAERRMIEAWRRAAELHAAIESAEY